MNVNTSKYYKLNRILLLSVGLWPYDESIFKRIKVLISCSIMVSGIAALIAKIIKSKYDMILTLRLLSIICPCCICVLKTIVFVLLSTNIKKLMEWIQNDWNTLKDINELEIIKKYTNFGRFCIIFLSVFGYSCPFILLLSAYFPDILDFVAPLNFSRVRKLPMDAEYFIDEQKYFYIIVYHIFIWVTVASTISIATETIYIAYINHICGMFKIVSYRLQCACNQDILQISPFVKNAVINTNIIAAIKMHKRALKLFDFLWSTFAASYFIFFFIIVISLSINLFRVFEAIVAVKEVEELLSASASVIIHLVYICFNNFIGQRVMDHSMEIHDNVYNIQWYRIPLQQQKLILFILHRSMRSCKLVAGNIFVLSLEGFGSILATSISYFTVLMSVHY